MSAAGWAQLDRADRRSSASRARCSGATSPRSTRADRRASTACSVRSSGSSTASAASIPEREQRWTVYALSVLAFSVVGFLLLYVHAALQSGLPFNPTDWPNVRPALSFNTAVSFVTNTNWQSYYPETTSATSPRWPGSRSRTSSRPAVGLAVDGRADPRPRPRRSAHDRQLLGRPRPHDVPHPSSRSRSCSRSCSSPPGVVQNLHGFTRCSTLAGATQVIPGGPSASQEAIKQLGTNGGGFFNVNSAHPFSNPTGFTDLLELYALLSSPSR